MRKEVQILSILLPFFFLFPGPKLKKWNWMKQQWKLWTSELKSSQTLSRETSLCTFIHCRMTHPFSRGLCLEATRRNLLIVGKWCHCFSLQESRTPSSVISQLAIFPLALPSNIHASPIALSRKAIGVAFERGQLRRMPAKGSLHKDLFFSVCSRPGAVCQSRSLYTDLSTLRCAHL